MRHQALISIKYRYVKLAFTFFGIKKKNTLYISLFMSLCIFLYDRKFPEVFREDKIDDWVEHAVREEHELKPEQPLLSPHFLL